MEKILLLMTILISNNDYSKGQMIKYICNYETHYELFTFAGGGGE